MRLRVLGGLTNSLMAWAVALAVGCAPQDFVSDAGVLTQADRPTAGNFQIHVIDVGTGLSVFVWANDFTLLYDAGSNDDFRHGANDRVLNYLSNIGFASGSTLNHVVLSHPHRDHVALMDDVENTYSVSNVWDSGALNDIQAYHCFIRAIAAHPATVYHTAGKKCALKFPKSNCNGTGAGESITITNTQEFTASPGTPLQVNLGAMATMNILYASPDHTGNFNDNSLVVRLDLRGNRILLMGDEEAGERADPTVAPSAGSVEAKLNSAAAQLQAKLLIVGHHGSMTSSRVATMQNIAPDYAVISAGPTKYGPKVILPDQQVVNMLVNRLGAAKVFRTDLNDRRNAGPNGVCETSVNKIPPGPADAHPGGCDNVQISITNGIMQNPVYYPRPL